jgi:hypothetical protein
VAMLMMLLVGVSSKVNELEWNYSNLEEICSSEIGAYPYQSPINLQSPFVYQGLYLVLLFMIFE